jgi:type IV pilus assembly protein PilY1
MQPRLTRKFLAPLALGWLGYATTAGAMPLSLSDTPLFLGFRVEPNIMFVVDDSGSMDWEVLTRDAANDGRFTGTQPDGSSPTGSGSVKHRDGDNNGTANCGFGTNGQTFYGYLYGVEFSTNTYGDDGNDCNTADEEEWRFRNSTFNRMYFDPGRTYTPWAGVDSDGNPFANMPITAAKDNPYDASSLTIDLTTHNSNWTGGTNNRTTSDRDGDGQADGFRYYTWVDANNNGLFDNGEETAHLIKNADAATQQNFANWFSYYRKREHAAKAAFGQVIANSTSVRMGLVTLHNHNNVKTAAALMNADPTTGNKRALLDNLYKIHSSDGTPLRNTLKNVGLYFECQSNSFFSSCPVLSAAQGGACQQNFAIMMTDGFWNGSDPGVGNTDTDGSGSWDGGAYADSKSNTLADVAMHFYERDLHSSLANNVPVIPGIDQANHQHMVTYTVSFGLNGQLTSDPSDSTTAFSWPDPFNSASAKIDDLRHAAYNGRGEFLSASNPQELIDTLNQALSSIAKRTSSAASVALNSGSHNANSRVYQARFNSGDWSGQLLSFPIDLEGQISTPEWDAGEVLVGLNYDTDREILTYNTTSRVGVPFRWNSLATTQQEFLNRDQSNVVDNEGEARLNYLRGSTTHEGTGNDYRVRLKRLGDLINSDPYFVGAPTFPDSLGSGYNQFRNANRNRTPMVYVGGNDGMLHAFNAVDGRERLAYVPTSVYANLSKLTDSSYTHQYFVDGSPTVYDAYANFGTSRCGSSSSCWRSILVSGLRKGGRGFFALDVTNPDNFDEGNAASLVLWEFTDTTDTDLGYSFSQPSIVRMANGEWAAIFGNGYNNNGSGRAVLYIVFLDRGLDGAWTPNSDYFKLDTGIGDTTTPNGLATPAAVDLDGDFKVEYIYAGDLRGNMWRFDVTNVNPSAWTAPVRLYEARNSANVVQPITARPEVGKHPLHTVNDPGVLVYFGTGKYLETGDNTTTNVPTQTFYAIWDKLETPLTAISRNSLLQQSVLSASNGRRVTSNNEVNWATHNGWYLDLPLAGERQVSDPALRNNRVVFTTLIPNDQICSFGGTSWLMEVDARTGGAPEQSPFDINDDKLFDDNDKVNTTINGNTSPQIITGLESPEGILARSTILVSDGFEIKFNSGSTGGIFVTRESSGVRTGRISWRELRN